MSDTTVHTRWRKHLLCFYLHLCVIHHIICPSGSSLHLLSTDFILNPEMQTSGRDGTHTEVIIALCSLTPEGNPHDHRVGFYGCLNMSPPLLHIERSWLRSYEEASRRTWWKLLSLYYFYIQIIISQTSEGKLFHLLTLIFLARCDSCDGNTDTFCFVRSSFARLTVFFFHITILAKDRTIFRGRDVNLSHSNCTRYLKCCKLRHFRVNKCFYGFNTELHVSILLSHTWILCLISTV